MNDTHRRAMRAKAYAESLYSGQPDRLHAREKASKQDEYQRGKRTSRPRFADQPEALFDD